MMSEFSTLGPLHPLQPSSRIRSNSPLQVSSEFRDNGFKDPLSSVASSTVPQSFTPSKHVRHGSHGETVPLPENLRAKVQEETGKAKFLIHKVTKLDTLAGLAIKYGVQVEHLKRFNRLTSEMQMFALGEIKIPLCGDGPSPLPSPGPTPSPSRGTAGVSSKDGKRQPSSSTGSRGSFGAAAAAAVATGRQAAAAASLLVESIDPELLMGVKGLRSAAESNSPGEEGDRGASKGAKAAALLLAIQQRTSRTSSLGMGISVEADDPLSRLTQSSSFNSYEEEQSNSEWRTEGWLQGRPRGRSSAGQLMSTKSSTGSSGGARRSLPFGQGNQDHTASGSFWEHEFRGEDQVRHDLLKTESSCVDAAGVSGFGSTSATSVKGEQVRRRGGGRSSGEDGSGLSSGEDETAGWLSADEYSSARPDVARVTGVSGGPWASRISGGSMSRTGMAAAHPRRQGSLRTGNGSVSYESLDGLKTSGTSRTSNHPGTVSVAAQWGTKVIDNFLSQFRHSGGWFLERSDHGGGLKGEGRGEGGIDLPVMNRSGGSLLVATGGSSASLGSASDKEVTSWASGAASASSTTRRSSKGKAALD